MVGVAAVLALIFDAYLAAVTSPEENLEDLPVAPVNEDEGAELAGERVDFGDRIVENATGPGSPIFPASGRWARPESREGALEASAARNSMAPSLYPPTIRRRQLRLRARPRSR